MVDLAKAINRGGKVYKPALNYLSSIVPGLTVCFRQSATAATAAAHSQKRPAEIAPGVPRQRDLVYDAAANPVLRRAGRFGPKLKWEFAFYASDIRGVDQGDAGHILFTEQLVSPIGDQQQQGGGPGTRNPMKLVADQNMMIKAGDYTVVLPDGQKTASEFNMLNLRFVLREGARIHHYRTEEEELRKSPWYQAPTAEESKAIEESGFLIPSFGAKGILREIKEVELVVPNFAAFPPVHDYDEEQVDQMWDYFYQRSANQEETDKIALEYAELFKATGGDKEKMMEAVTKSGLLARLTGNPDIPKP